MKLSGQLQESIRGFSKSEETLVRDSLNNKGYASAQETRIGSKSTGKRLREAAKNLVKKGFAEVIQRDVRVDSKRGRKDRYLMDLVIKLLPKAYEVAGLPFPKGYKE